MASTLIAQTGPSVTVTINGWLFFKVQFAIPSGTWLAAYLEAGLTKFGATDNPIEVYWSLPPSTFQPGRKPIGTYSGILGYDREVPPFSNLAFSGHSQVHGDQPELSSYINTSLTAGGTLTAWIFDPNIPTSAALALLGGATITATPSTGPISGGTFTAGFTIPSGIGCTSGDITITTSVVNHDLVLWTGSLSHGSYSGTLTDSIGGTGPTTYVSVLTLDSAGVSAVNDAAGAGAFALGLLLTNAAFSGFTSNVTNCVLNINGGAGGTSAYFEACSIRLVSTQDYGPVCLDESNGVLLASWPASELSVMSATHLAPHMHVGTGDGWEPTLKTPVGGSWSLPALPTGIHPHLYWATNSTGSSDADPTLSIAYFDNTIVPCAGDRPIGFGFDGTAWEYNGVSLNNSHGTGGHGDWLSETITTTKAPVAEPNAYFTNMRVGRVGTHTYWGVAINRGANNAPHSGGSSTVHVMAPDLLIAGGSDYTNGSVSYISKALTAGYWIGYADKPWSLRCAYAGAVALRNSFGLLYTLNNGNTYWKERPFNPLPASPTSGTVDDPYFVGTVTNISDPGGGAFATVVGVTNTSSDALVALLWDWDGTSGSKGCSSAYSLDRGLTWTVGGSMSGTFNTPPGIIAVGHTIYVVWLDFIAMRPTFLASYDLGATWA